VGIDSYLQGARQAAALRRSGAPRLSEVFPNGHASPAADMASVVGALAGHDGRASL